MSDQDFDVILLLFGATTIHTMNSEFTYHISYRSFRVSILSFLDIFF